MENRQRYFIHLAYNGKNYNGWQIQENAPSVQAVVNDACSAIFQTDINVVGCGRTDTGVHARSFYAHIDLTEKLDQQNKTDNLKKLNGFLPDDIRIIEFLPVQPDAHARFSATSRTYEYWISTEKDPFNNDYVYYLFGEPDIKKMNLGANILFDYRDFTSFSKLHTDTKTNNCIIKQARWKKEGNKLIFTIQSDRFLRNMVRAIVGTLLDIGKGKISIEDFKKIIESKNRSNAGYSVPAKALFLEDVQYPPSIFQN